MEYIKKTTREYLVNGDKLCKHCYRQHRKLHAAFRLAYLHLTLAHSKGQGKGHAQFDCEYLAKGDDKNYHCQQIESCMGPFNWHICI